MGKVEKGWWQKACRKSYKNGWTKIERKEERQWVGKAQGIDVFKNLSRGVRGSVPKAPPPSSLYVSKKGCGGENKKNGRKLGRGGGEGRF